MTKKILITGASGYISRILREELADKYELVLIDAVHSDGVSVVDLAVNDPEALAPYFDGVDCVIHNAFYRSPGHISMPPRQWLPGQPKGNMDGYFVERGNLDMAFNVYRAAQTAGVRRVIHTSSNHATDWYETLLHAGGMDMVDETTYPFSNGFYGWAKASMDGMGFIFATGRFGDPVESINIRIGGPRDFDAAGNADNQTTYRRELGAYLSDRDLRQLYVKSIETENIDNEHGIPFQIFYGISNNTRAYWSIANARHVIGYAPEDDSEQVYRNEIHRDLTAAGRTTLPRKATDR